MTMTHFDGSGKVTSRAWVHKLDTYLTLRLMTKEDVIWFVVLHRDGMVYILPGTCG